ncbi:MAG: hypothetical protein H6680_07850 [Desulfobacteraceae bacterium]|nr:hypothetical protein [Desulfobacteraceae bacterium]
MSEKNSTASAMAESIHLSFKFLYLAITILAAAWLFSGITQVSSGEQAIVLRFGKVHTIKKEPGLVFALPKPFDTIIIIPSLKRQLSLEVSDLAFIENKNNGNKAGLHPRDDGGYLIMGDGGILHIKGVIIYSITNALKANTGVADLKSSIRRIFCDAAIHICAGSTTEQILITEPEKIKTQIMNKMNSAATVLGLGIRIGRVDIMASLPKKAKDAFDNAQSASAQSSSDVARAEKSARLSIQDANREKASIISSAEAVKKEIISRAEIITNKILAQKENAKGKKRENLLRRIHHEAYTQGLQQAGKIVLVPDESASSLFIPGD